MKAFLSNLAGRQNLLRTLGTLAAVGLLFYLLSRQGWDEVKTAYQQIPAWRLALAMGLMILSRLAVSARWVILLRSGGVNVSIRQGLRINFAGLFANNFLPTTVGGDVIRLAGALQLNFNAAISTASLIVDRLVGMAGMAMVVPFGLPRVLQVAALQGGLLDDPSFPLAAAAVPALGKWGKQVWTKGMKILQSLLSALSLWLKQPRALFASMVLTWVHMLCLFAILSLLLTGMGEEVPFLLISGLYSLVYFVTLLPFSVNGYGLQELSMTLVFSTFAGISVGSGVTAALLFRTLMMLASLPGVFFVPEMLSELKLRRTSAG